MRHELFRVDVRSTTRTGGASSPTSSAATSSRSSDSPRAWGWRTAKTTHALPSRRSQLKPAADAGSHDAWSAMWSVRRALRDVKSCARRGQVGGATRNRSEARPRGRPPRASSPARDEPLASGGVPVSPFSRRVSGHEGAGSRVERRSVLRRCAPRSFSALLDDRAILPRKTGCRDRAQVAVGSSRCESTGR